MNDFYYLNVDVLKSCTRFQNSVFFKRKTLTRHRFFYGNPLANVNHNSIYSGAHYTYMFNPFESVNEFNSRIRLLNLGLETF